MAPIMGIHLDVGSMAILAMLLDDWVCGVGMSEDEPTSWLYSLFCFTCFVDPLS